MGNVQGVSDDAKRIYIQQRNDIIQSVKDLADKFDKLFYNYIIFQHKNEELSSVMSLNEKCIATMDTFREDKEHWSSEQSKNVKIIQDLSEQIYALKIQLEICEKDNKILNEHYSKIVSDIQEVKNDNILLKTYNLKLSNDIGLLQVDFYNLKSSNSSLESNYDFLYGQNLRFKEDVSELRSAFLKLYNAEESRKIIFKNTKK